MYLNWRCLLSGHRWSSWKPVGHIENREWRYCERGCETAEMREDPWAFVQGDKVFRR
jgi:hypothetical protein